MEYKKYIPKAIVLHHEAAANGFLSVNQWHRDGRHFPKSQLGWHVGYQYYISLQGSITQARKEDEEGMHTLGGWNRKSVGICLMGHLSLQNASEEQKNALHGLVEAIQQRWSIPDNRIYGHKELGSKACPGKDGMEIVEKLREVKPDLRKLERQIALLVEAIARLQALFNKLFR